MERIAMFAPLKGHHSQECFNTLNDFLPLPGARVTRKPRRGSFLYSMANTLAFPDKGLALLNYGDGFLIFVTRRKPKLHYTETSTSAKGQANTFSLGGRGCICFSDLLPTVFLILAK